MGCFFLDTFIHSDSSDHSICSNYVENFSNGFGHALLVLKLSIWLVAIQELRKKAIVSDGIASPFSQHCAQETY